MNMAYTVVQTVFQMMFKNCMNVQGRSSQGHMQMGIYSGLEINFFHHKQNFASCKKNLLTNILIRLATKFNTKQSNIYMKLYQSKKKTQILLTTSDYIFSLNYSKNVSLPETRL